MAFTVVITGASGGIGAALARRYARDGARLGLLGRNQSVLESVAADCNRLGATQIHLAAIDVRDRTKMTSWIDEFDRSFPADLVIANAGIMAGTSAEGGIEDSDLSYALMATNVLGVLNTLHPFLSRMAVRKTGQLALIGSIAGFTPMADAPSYAASKAAVLAYGLSLRAALLAQGVKVSVVCPGYVDTPMTTQMSGHKPWMMGEDAAAERIHDGLQRNAAVIAFPFLFACMARISGVLPDRLRRFVSGPFRFTVAARR